MAVSATIDQLIRNHRPGYSLEQAFYLDESLYKSEIDEIFMKNWLFAGHVSQIPNPGDYFLTEFDTESLIVVRGRERQIDAFLNVCRHRGSHICLEKQGSVKFFRCPYHAWSYDIDGSLKSARLMDPGFNKVNYGLHRAHVETLEGLIFVCFGDNPPSLKGARKDLAYVFDLLGTSELKLAAHKTYPIEANWKLTVENYEECYHCAPSHPEYSKLHTLKVAPDEYEQLQTHMRTRFDACGLKELEIDRQYDEAEPGEQGYAYSRTAMFEGFKTGSRTGEPIAPLIGKLKDYDSGASDLAIGPVSYFLFYSDHVVGYRFTPVDIQKSHCDIFWMVHKDAREGVDYTVDELTWLWDVTTKADETIIKNNQKGVNSRYYESGPFSQMEDLTNRFVAWYLNQISSD